MQFIQSVFSHFVFNRSPSQEPAAHTGGSSSVPPIQETSGSAAEHARETPCVSSDHDYGQNTITEHKLEAAQAEILDLQDQVIKLQNSTFGVERFGTDDTKINFYTGFNDFKTLYALFSSLKPTAENMTRWTQQLRNLSSSQIIKSNVFRNESLSLIDQFFVYLFRVRRGFPEQDLAVLFNVSQSSVSRILTTWCNYLYVMLGCLPIWPSRSVIDSTMPECFKITYPKTSVILDCTEIKVQTPSSQALNSEIYSNYKSHTTFKSLIGITPSGSVSFVSSLYTGAIGDKSITNLCGIVDLLEPNDQVMADQGFLIDDLLKTKQASLVIPPFLGQKGKFTEAEVMKTHEIARLRIHVEGAIRRIEEYHIFDGVVPLNLAPSINQYWTVCAILTNFKGPLF